MRTLRVVLEFDERQAKLVAIFLLIGGGIIMSFIGVGSVSSDLRLLSHTECKNIGTADNPFTYCPPLRYGYGLWLIAYSIGEHEK